MGWALSHFAVEAAPLAFILYAVIWRILRKPNLHSPRSLWILHILGATTVALGTGMTRLATAYAFGGQIMQELWTNRGIGLIGPVGVPVVLSVGAVLFVRTKTGPGQLEEAKRSAVLRPNGGPGQGQGRGTTTTEKATTMANGWQRLWVVLSVVWLVTIFSVSLLRAPKPEFTEEELQPFRYAVSESELRSQLTLAEDALLSDRYDLLAARLGGTIQNPYEVPPSYFVPRPADDPYADLIQKYAVKKDRVPSRRPRIADQGDKMSVKEFARMIKEDNSSLAKFNEDVIVASVLAQYPQYRARIDGQSLADASNAYQHRNLAGRRAFEIVQSLANQAAIRQSRSRAIVGDLATAFVPLLLLYLLGWSISWIRRGFVQP